MKLSVGNKVKIVGYNPTNRKILQEDLEKNFPIGAICRVNRISRNGLMKTLKDKVTGKVNCDEEDMNYCKESSESQCVRIENEEGIYTHICFLKVERI